MNGLPRRKPTIEVSALVFDKTGSMSETDYAPSRLEGAKEAALAFIRRKPVIDGRDRTAVVAFNESAFVASPFGRHPVEARGDLARLTAEGGTSITAGLRVALNLVCTEGKNFPGATLRCLVLSDGEHNDGAGPLEDGVVSDLQRHKVIVDCIAIGGAGERLLREIAKLTGGEFVRCQDVNTLIRRYDELAAKKSVSLAP